MKELPEYKWVNNLQSAIIEGVDIVGDQCQMLTDIGLITMSKEWADKNHPAKGNFLAYDEKNGVYVVNGYGIPDYTVDDILKLLKYKPKAHESAAASIIESLQSQLRTAEQERDQYKEKTEDAADSCAFGLYFKSFELYHRRYNLEFHIR